MAKYKAYPEYKDSGVEWLNSMPAHWSSAPIKYLALTTNSLFLDGDWIESKDISDDGVRYITTGNVGEGFYKEQGSGFITENTFNKLNCTEVFEGDILISRLNNPIGRACLVPNLGCKTVTSVDNVIFRTDKYYNRKYLVHLFSSKDYFQHTGNLARGTTMQRISRGLLGNIRIPVPTVPEQVVIAAFLDHETVKIDNLIEKQQQLIELLKEKRQAIISHAVTKGLNPNVPMKDSGVEWLGEVPAHWRVGRIKNYARIESGHTPSRTKPEYWVSCNIPWVSLNDSKQLKEVDYIEDTYYKISELGMANSSAHILPARAVVFTRDASIGLSAITTKPMAVSQHLIAWVCDEDFIIPEYLLLVFYAMEKEFERYTFGATIKTIGMDNVRGLKSTFPPVEEQRNLIDWAFNKIEKIKSSINKVEDMLSLLQERRTALISAAVTGKIDVRDWVAPDTQEAEEPQEATA